MYVKFIDLHHIQPARNGADATPEGRAALIADGFRPLALSTEQSPATAGVRPRYRYEVIDGFVVRRPDAEA